MTGLTIDSPKNIVDKLKRGWKVLRISLSTKDFIYDTPRMTSVWSISLFDFLGNTKNSMGNTFGYMEWEALHETVQ
jgi:hypothetical protein